MLTPCVVATQIVWMLFMWWSIQIQVVGQERSVQVIADVWYFLKCSLEKKGILFDALTAI